MPDLFAVAATGGRPKRLTATPEVENDPLVSPDGRRVMFERFPLGGGAPAVVLARLGGGRPTLLARHGRVGVWSRDGRQLAYLGKLELGGARPPTIYLARPDGSHRRALARGLSPTWSPDGRRLASGSGTDGTVRGPPTRFRSSIETAVGAGGCSSCLAEACMASLGRRPGLGFRL